jgi:hypothetical protein
MTDTESDVLDDALDVAFQQNRFWGDSVGVERWLGCNWTGERSLDLGSRAGS